jgi:hypothetical protein
MADTKISALTASTTPLAGTEVLPIVQSSTTKQVSVANLTAGRSVSVADLAVSANNVVPGTAAKGVNFTANTPAAGMTSQLLKWYEEGTWTPSFISTGLSITHTVQNGKYTRVGNIVNASFYIRVVSSAGTLTNPLEIQGLPFASLTGTEYGFSCAIGVHQFTLTPSIFIGAGVTKLAIYQNGTITALTGAALGNGYYLGTINYQTN